MTRAPRHRVVLVVLSLATVLSVALWPRPAYSCGIDIACHVDTGIVTFLRFLAELGWFFNGNLIGLSRWLEMQREWLITGVMASVFDNLLRGISVTWAMAVVLAMILFVIGFSLRAVADLNWVDLRRGLRSGFIALIVFTYGGQLMAGAEGGRMLLTQAVGQLTTDSLTATTHATTPTGGSVRPGDLMPPVQAVYDGAVGCANIPARTVGGPMINDIAATYLFASATDIHCPSDANPNDSDPSLPRAFWSGGAYHGIGFVGYYRVAPRDAADESDRQRIVALAIAGTIRQFFGLFLALAAVLEQIIHFIFAFGIVVLWITLAISLVFALFVPTEGMLGGVVRTGVVLIKQVILTTIGVTVVTFVMTMTAASSGVNSGLVAFIAMLAMAILFFLVGHAGKVVFTSVAQMGSTTLGAAPAVVAGTAAGFGLAAAMAVRGSYAARQPMAESRREAEAAARASGASDLDAKRAGNAAAWSAYRTALRTSATRTVNDAARLPMEAAGFVRDPIRQSLRWQDRADAERRQQEVIAAVSDRDERRSDAQGSPLEQAGAGTTASAGAPLSSTAARLRNLPPVSPNNPSTKQTASLGGGAAASPTHQTRAAAADAAVTTEAAALHEAERHLERDQNALAAARARAAVQPPSVANEREVERLEGRAEKSAERVVVARQRLSAAEQVQHEERDAHVQQRAEAESTRAWGDVARTLDQRDPQTGELPRAAVQQSLRVAEQQLDRDRQQRDRQPASEQREQARGWMQRQQAELASLRRWDALLADPTTAKEDRVAALDHVAAIRDRAGRDHNQAVQTGDAQRARIAGGVLTIADAMLPPSMRQPAPAPTAHAAPAPAPTPAGVAQVAAAPAGSAQAVATPAGVAHAAPTPAGSAQAAPAPAGSAPAAPVAAGVAQAAPTPASSVPAAPAPTGSVQATAAPAGSVQTAAAPAGSAQAVPTPAGSAQAAPVTASVAQEAPTPAGSVPAAPGIGIATAAGSTTAQRLRDAASDTPAAATPAPAAPVASPAPVTPATDAGVAVAPAPAASSAAPVASPAPSPAPVAPAPAPSASASVAAPVAPVAPAPAAPSAAPIASPAPSPAPVAPAPAPSAPAPVASAAAPVASPAPVASVAPAPAAPSAAPIASPAPVAPAAARARVPQAPAPPDSPKAAPRSRRIRVGGTPRTER